MMSYTLLLKKIVPILGMVAMPIIGLTTLAMVSLILLSFCGFFIEYVPLIVLYIISTLILLLGYRILKILSDGLYGMDTVIFKLIIILALLAATFSIVPGYFETLRFLIFIALLLLILQEYRKKELIYAYIDDSEIVYHMDEGYLIIVTYIVILILFNPIYPLYFYDKNIWIFIDVFAAFLLFVVIIRDIIIGIKFERKYLDYKTKIELEDRIVIYQKIKICEMFLICTHPRPEINYPDDYPRFSPNWTFKEKILLGDYDLYFHIP